MATACDSFGIVIHMRWLKNPPSNYNSMSSRSFLLSARSYSTSAKNYCTYSIITSPTVMMTIFKWPGLRLLSGQKSHVDELLKECRFMRGKYSVPRESYACVCAHKNLWCGCQWEWTWTASASRTRETPHLHVCMENLWKTEMGIPSPTQDHCEHSTPFKDKIKGLRAQNEFDLWHQSHNSKHEQNNCF